MDLVQKKKKTWCGFGWVGRWEELGGVGGGLNDDQNILYEKIYFQFLKGSKRKEVMAA